MMLLFVVIPGAILGILLAFGAIISWFSGNFTWTDPIAIVLLVLPSYLAYRGITLGFSLSEGYTKRNRRLLFHFYLVVFLYCAMWLFFPMHRDGISSTMFGADERTGGLAILLSPLIALALMRPETNKAAESGRNGD